MTRSRRQNLTKGIGALVGVCLAVVALQGWQVSAGTGALPAALAIEVNPTGEFEVDPVGRFFAAAELKPGTRPESDSFRLHNQTARSLGVRLRARPSIRDLDGILELRVTAGGHELFEGALGDLRRWTPTVRLSAEETRDVAVSAWLPPGTTGHEGRRATIVLELEAAEA